MIKEQIVWKNGFFNIFILILACVTMVNVTHVNSHDTDYFLDAMGEFWAGDFAYGENTEPPFSYMSPPHAAIIAYPFLIFGHYWSAFWDLFFVFFLLMGVKDRLMPNLLKLIFLFSPPILYVIAAANMTTVTGIGLVLLLNGAKGYTRGVAWAFMLVRPQDTLLILLFEAALGLYERDWRAFAATAGILVIPALMYSPMIYPQWLGSLARDGSYLGIWETRGSLIALAVIVAVFLPRLVTFNRENGLSLRSFREMYMLEYYWLMIAFLMIVGPYTRVWMIWLTLIPLRNMNTLRTLIFFAITTVAGILFMRFNVHSTMQWGMIAIMISASWLMPQSEEPMPKFFAKEPKTA